MRALRLYVSVVIAVGGAALGASLVQLAGGPHRYEWAIFAALSILTGSFNVNLGAAEASISVADTFFITSALLYGPAAGALTIAADSLVLSALRRRHSISRGLFNTLGATLSMYVASRAFFALAGIEPLATSHASIAHLIVPLTALAVLYFALNCGLVAGAVALESNTRFLEVWRTHFLWLATGYFAAASLAFCLVLLIQQSSLLAAVIVLPLLAIFHLTLRASFGRLDDARRHLHAMDRLYLSTIETLAMAIDAKDDVTHSHVRRVQTLAMALARAMGVTDDAELRALEAAALLHDTGKLAVPEHILNKPGGLTDAEFEKMKLHVDIGADILSLVGFPFPVVPIVRCHHENWDGSGYPNGIAGDAIPIGARILSVVDCFDALTSDRPYRRRLPDEAALDILRERSGRMYDPSVVETFVRIRKDIVIEETDHAAKHQVMQRISETRHTPPPVAAGAGAEPLPDSLLTFVSLSRLASGEASQADVLSMASQLMTQMLPAVSGAWFVPDTARDSLVAAEAFGSAAPLLRGMCIGVGDRLTGWVAATRQMIANSSATLDLGERAGLAQPPMSRCLSVPLAYDDRLVAVLTLYAAEHETLDAQHSRLLQIVAPHVAQALAAASETSTRPASKAPRDLRLVAGAR